MGNPNSTAIFSPRPYPTALTSDWRKYIIHASTPNDTRLDFDVEQKSKIAKADITSYDFPAWGKPNTGSLGLDTDIPFMRIVSPTFPIWVEKIKICLHQSCTYGCIKVNVWDFGDSESNTPNNIAGIDEGEDSDENIPVTIFSDQKLISNVLVDTDLYMVETEQTSHYDPFDYTIAANSYLRFGLQYAEGNAYGLKVFIIGWMLECDQSES